MAEKFVENLPIEFNELNRVFQYQEIATENKKDHSTLKQCTIFQGSSKF